MTSPLLGYRMDTTMQAKPSLEALIESEVLPLEILHPGGLGTTGALAELCGIAGGTSVLDVASGTGESACFLSERFGAAVVGVDRSARMVERASRKASERQVQRVRFIRADAHQLPIRNGTFGVVISECTLSLLDKAAALEEMARVVASSGRVGIHEICWREDAPDEIRQRLLELEGEEPESLMGWKRLFEAAGLRDVQVVDRSDLIPLWMQESKRSLGISGQLRAAGRVLWRWGLEGLGRVLASERLFRSDYLGYGIVVGVKP